MDLFLTSPDQDHSEQGGFSFPQSLTEKYRPRLISDFVGLDKPKKIAANLVASPRESAWLFKGPSGTGKTTLAMAIADAMPAELHHIPSQSCNLETIERIRMTCQYVPMAGKRMHLVLADEIDQLTPAAQISLLSKQDATNFFPQTVFIGTCNAVDRLEDRFLSRFHVVEFSSYGLSSQVVEMLQGIWDKETGGKPAPNLARIVKDSNNNVRESLMRVETELMCV